MTVRSRKFAVFDIDGTLVRWQLYHAIVEELIAEHKLPTAICESIVSAHQTWKKRSHSLSFQDYEYVLWQAYVAALKTLSVADIDHAMERVFDQYKDQVYTYTRDLIRKLKKENYVLLAVSGSHQEIVEKIGDYYGFDGVVGTKYLQEDGVFTGEEVSIVRNKGAALQELVKGFNVTWEDSIAIGDSKSDASMFELVTQPIAFNPNAELFAVATEKNWKVVVERKNMVYELEGHNGQYILAKTDR